MIKISSRARITIVSILTAVLYAIFFNINFNDLLHISTQSGVDFFKALALGVFLYIGTAWALFFRIKGERFITVLLFPALGTMALSLLAELIVVNLITGSVDQIAVVGVSTLIVGFYTYICLLTVNLLNAKYLENIPLAQAARAALFIIALIDAYLIFFMAYSNDLFIFLRVAVVAITSGLLMYIALWTIELRLRYRLNVTFAVALVLAFISGILSMWPLQAPYLALILSLFFYIFMNIALEMREIIGKWIWVEYLILFGLVVVLLITFSEWGINGALL